MGVRQARLGLALVALLILGSCAEELPTPAPNPTSAVATAIPTEVPTPTPTAVPSPTPTPTMTPIPAPTVTPTPTPIPRDLVVAMSVTQGSGEYRLIGTQTWVAIKAGDGLAVGDRVRSAQGSVVALTFRDGSVLVLEPNSELEIQSFTMTTQADRVMTRVARVATIKGTLSGDVRDDLIYPPSVFEIVTAGEIITIQGTLTE